jgi:hypothetical protein
MTLVKRHKSQAFWVEVQLDFANWTVTMLGNDKVCDVRNIRIVRLVVARAVDEADDIGILLD